MNGFRIMSSRTQHILIFALRLGLALAGVALLWMMVFRAQDAAWERLQRGEPLRVALDPTFPPFEDVDASGQVVGFDVDLAREIGQRLDAPVSFISIGFDGLADAVMADRADVVISAFPYDERLTQDVRYSRPYFEAGLVLVTDQNSNIASPAQLANATVAVEWGSEGDAWTREQGLRDILRTETPDDALNAVLNGQADVAVVDAVTAALFPQQGIIVQAPPLVSEPYVIVLSRHASRLGDAVDNVLNEIIADGTWTSLVGRYFPNPPQPPAGGR